jgi:hypothetical protein
VSLVSIRSRNADDPGYSVTLSSRDSEAGSSWIIVDSNNAWACRKPCGFNPLITECSADLPSSVMLYHVGFGCRQETEHLRVGPYSKGEHITASDVQQMDRYMMRVWLEMQAFLTSYCHRQGMYRSS